jgi:predicted transcriptional regulator
VILVPPNISTDTNLRTSSQGGLGHLEAEVLEILWRHGECSVRDVQGRLGRRLAYTTVMTTLDRLYKKGRLERSKSNRSFRYAPMLSRVSWGQERAETAMANLLSVLSSGDALISCLVEVVAKMDVALLEQMEREIAARRVELDRDVGS